MPLPKYQTNTDEELFQTSIRQECWGQLGMSVYYLENERMPELIDHKNVP